MVRNVYAILSKAESLKQLLHGWHVDGGPGQPGPLSRDMVRVVAAGVIRDLAAQIEAPRTAATTRKLGLDLLKRGTAGLVAGYDGEGPPWIDYPWPLPWPPKTFDPAASIFGGLRAGALDTLLASAARQVAAAVDAQPATGTR